ncbi:SIR2 family protein [Paractinoplanes globisporus]|uniref:SIR2 family protein n=1 Tax=Paractinoplanes globisporus TaxID=113565 RepID=A0ABW6WTE2_9ACTN|nr:SIR2 family protein [Actinoplanes globisporus]
MDATEDLAQRLYRLGRDNLRVTLFAGFGLSAAVMPTTSDLLAIADDYAESHPGTAGLLAALRRARARFHGDDVRILREYRAAFTGWLSADAFDLIAQAAVLQAYQAPRGDDHSGPRPWQSIEAAAGEEMERDIARWTLPDGVAALGSVLARSDMFSSHVFTTCFDPLLEIAVARSGAEYQRVTRLTDPFPADAVGIHHLHGYWRPEYPVGPALLARSSDQTGDRDVLARQLADRISETPVICVLAYSDGDGILAAAIRRVAASGKRLTVLWAAESIDEEEVGQSLRAEAGPAPVVTFFPGVNSDVLLPRLAHLMRLPVTLPERVIRNHRHTAWERELLSEPGTAPPDDPLDLLRQLDRRYQWERSWSGEPVAPRLIYWPVRLRSSPSVINMVQALAAAALSARGVEVMICLDDFNVEDAVGSTRRYREDVDRWFNLVSGSRLPQIVSLQEFVDASDQSAGDSPRHLLRPTRPWDVAREAVGERNPSVLDLLMAAKVIPDLPEEQLIAEADKIVTALVSRGARNLLLPFTLWSHLNELLLDRPSGTIMTLGGKEERRLWAMWRFAFDHGVNQLYNPTLRSLTNQSVMLRWPDEETLRRYLHDAMREGDWAEEGHYVWWLAQNAFLLPMYLRDLEPPSFEGVALDSWPAVQQALSRAAAVDLIAEHVSRSYLGRTE